MKRPDYLEQVKKRLRDSKDGAVFIPSDFFDISDGPYKTYEADGMTLKFKHTDNKNELINISYKTALVIQALKALGKGNITDKELRSISKLLTENEKAQMLMEAKRVTAWVYELVRKICKAGCLAL